MTEAEGEALALAETENEGETDGLTEGETLGETEPLELPRDADGEPEGL